MKQKITRQERGLGLFRSGAIVKKTDDGYLVTGSNGNEYEVRCDYDQWTCDCKDSQFRGHGGSATDLCKHAYLVKYWLETSVPTSAPSYDKHDIHMHREKMLVVF